MSELANLLKAERRPANQTFEAWLNTLDADDRAALEAARIDPQLSNAAIVRAVNAVGGTANKDRISAWRRRG